MEGKNLTVDIDRHVELLEATDLGRRSLSSVDFGKKFDPGEWEPHQLKSGHRRGMMVFKNKRTHALRDSLPAGHEVGIDGQVQKESPSWHISAPTRPGVSEREWDEADSVRRMFTMLSADHFTTRIRRLFAVACARQVEGLMEPAGRYALTVAERYADGAATTKEAHDAGEAILHGSQFSGTSDVARANRAAFWCTQETGYVRNAHETAALAQAGVDTPADLQDLMVADERHRELLREIAGPYEPVTMHRKWLTPDVKALTKDAYDRRDLSAMHALSDALEEAGCDNPKLLNALRTATIIKGNWALDLVRGRR